MLMSLPLLMMQHPGLCQEGVWLSLITPLTVPVAEPPHSLNQERFPCVIVLKPLCFSHRISKTLGCPFAPTQSANTGSPRSRTAVVIPEGFGAALWEVIILGGWLGSWKDCLVNLRAQLERLINV